jgi:hypothetical protein
VQPFLHSNPYFLPKVRMDRDRGEVWPGIFIKKFQSGFPRFDHSRPLLNTLLVNKLWRPVGYFPRKGPASLSPNSRKSNGATFRSKLNDDFVFVHGVPQSAASGGTLADLLLRRNGPQLALNGHGGMSFLSPLRAPKRTSTNPCRPIWNAATSEVAAERSIHTG